MNARRVYSRSSGVVCDQAIAMNGFYVSKDYPEQLRRVRFKDSDSGKTLDCLINNASLPPLIIAALYKCRWQVELFFKWIRQHLRIKRFLGTSENAVKTQIWCVVSTYVLIAIVKKEIHPQCLALHLGTDFVSLNFRENQDFMRLAARCHQNYFATH